MEVISIADCKDVMINEYIDKIVSGEIGLRSPYVGIEWTDEEKSRLIKVLSKYYPIEW